MSKEFPLQTLLDLSHTRTDEAATQLGHLVASEQAVEQKLTVLIQYRDEYRDRFVAAAKSGLNHEQWRNFRSFLARLDDAICQQEALVEKSKQRTASGQNAWLGERKRLRAFDTLSQRHREHAWRAKGKAEQRMTDEHAAKSRRAGRAD